MNKEYQLVLENAGIRPSIQRIAVYRYLCENPVHPDVETVYADLAPSYPTISKTTVYNTLKLFEEKKIVQSIKIEDDKLRFDAEMRDHFHFKCIKCNKIFDIFSESEEHKLSEQCEKILPSGFLMTKVQTNLWGTCRECACK